MLYGVLFLSEEISIHKHRINQKYFLAMKKERKQRQKQVVSKHDKCTFELNNL